MESVRKALGENLSRIRRRKHVAGATLAVAVLLLSAAVLIPSIQSEPEGYSGDYYTVTYNIGAVPTVAGHNESTGATSSITVRYYGTPVAEYNPQFWAGSIVGQVLKVDGADVSDNTAVKDWFKITSYPGQDGAVSNLKVFSGWKVGSAIVDPGTDLTGYANVAKEITLEAVWSGASWLSNGGGWTNGTKATGDSAKYLNLYLLRRDLSSLSSLSNLTVRNFGTSFSISTQNVTTGGNLIIDNVNLSGAYDRDLINDHGNGHALYGNGSLIIGTGVGSISNTYVQVLGGWKIANAGTAKLTVFSGTYEIIAGGSYDTNVGKTELVLAGSYDGSNLKVNGTVYGGNTEKGDIGSTSILIVGGMVSDREKYSFSAAERYQTVIGGTRNSGNVGTTEVVLSGTAKAFMVQGGGRASNVKITESASVTISGMAKIYYMACGSVTDGNGNEATYPVKKATIRLKDAAVVGEKDKTGGLLLGGGWDTWSNPLGSSAGSTNVFVEGGTVWGSVYGGGFRGSVGSGTGQAVNVEISGGTIHGSVYGGGKGGPEPFTSTSAAYWNTTGRAYILGDLSLKITSGTVMGSVYGGGEGAQKTWGDTNGVEDAARVTGNITLAIEGKAEIHGSVYGGGKGFQTSEKSHYQSSVDNVARVSGNTSISIDEASIGGSVYGGGAYGRVVGSTTVQLNGGTVSGGVFAGGLGEDKTAKAVEGTRTAQITGGIVGANVYGSSAYGNDLGDSNVSVSGGEVRGSVFGGGYKGLTTGNTSVSVSGTAKVAMSVYGGADVGDTSADNPQFDKTLVTGDSRVDIDGRSGATVGRSVFGSGNSCLVGGDSFVTIIGLEVERMESVQRATVAIIESSRMVLSGRSDGSTSQASSKYSLNRIEELRLVGGTYLGLGAAVGSIGKYGSYVTGEVPSTSASPLNTVRLIEGTVLSIEKEGTFRDITGFTILSLAANELYHGALAYGSTQSTGGFVIMKDGSFVIADSADLNADCRCWYIAGAKKQTETIVAKSGSTSVSSEVFLSKVFPDTELVYIGHSAEGDRLVLKDTVPAGSDEFRLTVGEGGNTTFEGGSLIPVGEFDYGSVRKGTVASGQVPRIGLKLEHFQNLDYSGHAGYVTLRFWEAVEVEVGTAKGWIAQNQIDLELDIRTESSAADFGGDYEVTIETKKGSGSAEFIIPRSFAGYEVDVTAYETMSSGTLSIQPVVNSEGTRGWDMPMADGKEASVGRVGTLSGAFAATLQLSIEGADQGSTGKLTMELALPDGTKRTFTVTVVTEDAGSHLVTFKTRHRDGSAWVDDAPREIFVPDGEAIPLARVPETGNNFVGWFLTQPENDDPFYPVGEYDLATPVTGDITLYACYRWEVTFDYGNGSSVTLYVPVTDGGSEIGSPNYPARTGYDFQHWKDEGGDIVFAGGSKVLVTDDAVFTAVWKGVDCEVTYRYDGAVVDTVVYEYGSTYGDPMRAVTNSLVKPAGSEFIGWKHGDSYVHEDVRVAAGAHELVAVVTADPTLHVNLVIGDPVPSHGGERIVGPSDYHVRHEGTGFAFVPGNAVATGHELKGWRSTVGTLEVPVGAQLDVATDGGEFVVSYGGQSVRVPSDGILTLETVWQPLMYEVIVEQPIGGEIVYTGGASVPYGTELVFEYIPKDGFTLKAWGHNGEGGWTIEGDRMTHRVVSDCYVYASVNGLYIMKLELSIDGAVETGKRLWLHSEATGLVPMAYTDALGCYFAETRLGSYDLYVERTDSGTDSVLFKKLYIDRDDETVRGIGLHTITLTGDTEGSRAPQLAQEGRTVAVQVPEKHSIERIYYEQGGAEVPVVIAGSSFTMVGHPVTVVVKKDLVEVTVTVFDPPVGTISVKRGSETLIPETGYGEGQKVYKANVGETLEFTLDLGTSGEELHRWMVNGVAKHGDEQGVLKEGIEGNTAVFAVLQLEGGKQEYTKRSLSFIAAYSGGSYEWENAWGSSISVVVELDRYGYTGAKLNLTEHALKITGLKDFMGVLRAEGIVFQSGGEFYSLDLEVLIVPPIYDWGF